MIAKHLRIREGLHSPLGSKLLPRPPGQYSVNFWKFKSDEHTLSGIWWLLAIFLKATLIVKNIFFGFTVDDISWRADIHGESDISADERSDKSSTEDKGSNSSLVESQDEKWWCHNLEFVVVEDFNKPTRSTTVLPATATAGDFFNLFFPEDLIQLIVAIRNWNPQQKQQKSATVNKDWIP